MQRRFVFFASILALLGASCSQAHHPAEGGTFVDGGSEVTIKHCGEVGLADVRSATDQSLGILEISNDSSHLHLTYSPPIGGVLNAFQIFCGAAEDLPMGRDGAADPEQFPLHADGLREASERTLGIEWSDMPPCITVAAHFRLTKNGEAVAGLAGWTQDLTTQRGVPYCRKSCQVTALVCSLGNAATLPQTLAQDQWIGTAAEAPISLLSRHFKRIFPQGISLGCDQRLSYATADQALAAMPSAGDARALTANGVGPAGNSLAGELLSLTLMAKLDDVILEFTPHSTPLKRLEVSTGAFEGWTIEEVAQEANIVLGGCTTNFTAEQIYEVVREINLSFAEGGKHDFLRCPDN